MTERRGRVGAFPLSAFLRIGWCHWNGGGGWVRGGWLAWAASWSEDRHKDHDGAAETPGSAGSPRFSWTGR